MTAPPPPASSPPSRRLGRLLVEDGRLTRAQIDEALRIQGGTGLRLGELLVRDGRIDAETVARLLGRQLGLDYAPPPLNPEPTTAEVLGSGPARALRVVPLASGPRRLRLAMSDPLDLDAVQEVAFRTGRRVDAVVSSPRSIATALDRLYGGEVERIAADLDPDEPHTDARALEEAAAAAPVVRLVDRILRTAVERGASDVHLEPEGELLRVRLRIDGILGTSHELPGAVRDAVLSRLKILAGMDIAVRRRPQDGGFRLERALGPLSLRVSTLPVGRSEKAVVRILDPGRVPEGLGALGLAPREEARIRSVLDAGEGVLLATGPTGSGKSSTLQAALKAVDRERANVVALEDPVEYRVPGVVHVGISVRAGLTFPSALRAVLRQDPDVVMVGEIRDRETAEIAMAAAVTGHLVLSSLHTTDAPGALTRLLHMGVPPYLVGAGVAGVVAQRLVRTLCGRCRGRGCDSCRDGFAGRTGVFQVMVMDDRMREAIATGATAASLRRLARAGGMGTLADDARRVVAEGRTSPHEAGRAVRGDADALRPCGGCGGALPAAARACPWCGRPPGSWCRCGERLEAGWCYCAACGRRR